jgi:hypothetical protein
VIETEAIEGQRLTMRIYDEPGGTALFRLIRDQGCPASVTVRWQPPDVGPMELEVKSGRMRTTTKAQPAHLELELATPRILG